MEDKNIIRTKSFDFAVRVAKLCQFVSKNHNEYVLTRQLLKSGTSIGANIRESTNAESTAEFIHKLAISQKECDETLYWLELMKADGYLKDAEFESMSKDCTELLKILRSIILTKKENLKNQKSS